MSQLILPLQDMFTVFDSLSKYRFFFGLQLRLLDISFLFLRNFLLSGIVYCCRKCQPFIHSLSILLSAYYGLDSNVGAGVKNQQSRQDVCHHRDPFLVQEDKV